jgi:hypothetical protein
MGESPWFFNPATSEDVRPAPDQYEQAATWNDYTEHQKETPVPQDASPSLLPSLIRTVVPLLVGILITWAAKAGLNLAEGDVTALLTALITAVYYATVRLIEQKFPAAGWLLGYPAAPTYGKPATPDAPDAGEVSVMATLVTFAVAVALIGAVTYMTWQALRAGAVHSALTWDPVGRKWI